jgi:hypothetical protein
MLPTVFLTLRVTWAHLNGVLHKSLPSVWVPVCTTPHLCKATPRQTNTRNNRRIVDAWYSMRSVSYQRKVGYYFFQEFVDFSHNDRLQSLFLIVMHRRFHASQKLLTHFGGDTILSIIMLVKYEFCPLYLKNVVSCRNSAYKRLQLSLMNELQRIHFWFLYIISSYQSCLTIQAIFVTTKYYVNIKTGLTLSLFSKPPFWDSRWA